MNSEWQTFLKSRGATIDTDGRSRFTVDPTSAECALFDLSHLGVIAVEGADTEQFLQGQLTNDIRELSEEHSQLSSHCSPKGRMLANFRLLKRGATVLLQMPAENIEAMLKRLNMFKLMSKVTVDDLSDRYASVGLAGDCAEDLLAPLFPKVPELHNGATVRHDTVLVRLPGESSRFLMVGPTADIIDLWDKLSETAVPADADRWALIDIRAGLPTVYGTTVEAFVPQMTNMQLVDGVSFTKGCYTGQEVIARMQYLGKLKRRMYRAELDTDQCPRPGEELTSDASSSGQGAGRVVDARPSDDGRCELLVVVENAAVERNDVRLGENGPALRFLDLPYAFEEPEQSAD